MLKKIINIIFTLLIIIICIINVYISNNTKKKYIIATSKYVETTSKSKFIHFSIDDVINIFEDLTINEKEYDSIFENKILKYLRFLHDNYGAKFSLYCFGQNDNFKLENSTTKFKKEFEKNSDWLQFGFHAFNNKKNYNEISSYEIKKDYNYVINNLEKIVGAKSITTVVRLEKFIISSENLDSIINIKNGITGLLGADTQNRQNYYLTKKENQELFDNEYMYDNEKNIYLYNTDFRLENVSIKNLKLVLKKNKEDDNLIIFTHEFMFFNTKDTLKTMYKLKEICEYAIKNEYVFSYPNR